MDRPTEIEARFWKALKGDRTTMLGLSGIEEGHSQPMTAQLLEEHEEGGGPIWFFTANDTDLVRALGQGHRAQLHFSSKGHDLFAAVHGELTPSCDRVTIDRLWNRFVAAWFEGGKTTPSCSCCDSSPIGRRSGSTRTALLAGVKLLLGRDPKQEYQEKVADVRLDRH